MLPAGKGRSIGLLEVRDIHSHCGDSCAVQGVSLQVDRSEVVGILGRSGMGKTSLDVLLMDEPTEGLAPLLVREAGRVIGDLKARSPSILLVEQIIPRALRVTDHVHVLSRGRIVHSCPPDALGENEKVKARYLGL